MSRGILVSVLMVAILALLLQQTMAAGRHHSKPMLPRVHSVHNIGKATPAAHPIAGVFPSDTEEPRRVLPVAGVFPPENDEPRRSMPVAGVFPPETEEPRRTRPVAGVFPPETEEPRRTRPVAGVFPPETEEPRRTRPVAGVFPPETEEPRRTRPVAGVFPPETEEPRRTRPVAGVFPPETEEPHRISSASVCSPVTSCDQCSGQGATCSYSAMGQPRCCERSIAGIPTLSQIANVASVSPISQNPIPSWASPSDICNKKRSCDACSASQYCRYTDSGVPSCCGSA